MVLLPVLEKCICSICLEPCRHVIRELPCGHAFCPRCIDAWLCQHPTCPQCRRRVGRPIMRKPVPVAVQRPASTPDSPLWLLVLVTASLVLLVAGFARLVQQLPLWLVCLIWWLWGRQLAT